MSNRCTTLCLAVVLSLLSIGPFAHGADRTIAIGGIRVPADSALARKEHPRLLFTKADLPAIRARIAQPGLKPIYERMKKTVDEQLAQGPGRVQAAGAARMLVPLGLLYYLTGEEKYGQACREVTLAAPFGCYATEGAYGYDLAYELMTPDQRGQCEKKMLSYIAGPYPEGSVFTQCVGLWGSGNEDARVAAKLAEMRAWCLRRKVELNAWAADRGGDGNSHAYIGQHEYVGTVGAFQGWRAATGEDWFDGFLWAKAMAPYYVYHLLPNRRLTVNVGINSWGGRHAPIETGAEDFLSIAQAKWNCGLTGWWVRNVVCSDTAWYNILSNDWGMVLFYDPAVPDVARDAFPQDMLFKTRGYVTARSDWDNDATFVHFHSGRFETDGRNQCDNNSFIIYRKAHLACDSGTRGVNNPENTQYSDGKHHENYFAQTIAHNSITVGAAANPSPLCHTVFGGQVSRVPFEWLKQYGLPVNDEGRWNRQAGAIRAYETTPEFCYAVGDARCSYDPSVVKEFTRQFLYVRPGAVIVFDRVAAFNPKDVKRWYLHTMEQPECSDGELTPDTTVHRDGHFLATGRTLRSPHGGSVLYSKTVLPDKAVIRVLGGKGHQFEVGGENYDMYDVWWQKVGTSQYQEEIGLGWWRVEVEPQVQQAEDVFLHVLWATDDRQKTMFPVEKISAAGRAGVKFTADGLDVEVTFATTGSPAGHIRLAREGREITNRPLAGAVEDHYDKWTSDARFQAWMTDPAMRAVIGGKK
ncbi:MAG: heparinase II/III domain-containing protein [Pirellulales bacterium]